MFVASAPSTAPNSSTTPTFLPPSATPSSGNTPTATTTPGGNGSGLTNWTTNYTYDLVDNRLTQTRGGTTTYANYNVLDQLACSGTNQSAMQSNCAGQITYSYNRRGDLTSVTNGTNVATYTWDARDRMIGATANGQNVTFAYDDSGHRIQQVASGQTTNYLWDEFSPYGDVTLETDGSGATLANYALGGTELLAQNRNNVTSYYLYDGQNSVRALMDGSGNVTDSYVYDAYGNLQRHSGNTVNSYQYTGQQFDSATGLYDLRARYYDPTTGRFDNRDTIQLYLEDTGQYNKYIYTSDNPVTSDDPTGHGIIEELGKATVEFLQKTYTAIFKVFIGTKLLEMCEEQGDCSPAAIIAKVQELGQEVATRAREVYLEVADKLGGYRPPVTIAVGKIGDELYYAVNSSASQTVINLLQQITGRIPIIGQGDDHAEIALYKFAQSLDQELVAIGISRTGGPCPQVCQPFFDTIQVPVFFLGKLFLALEAGD